jgi:hypothetical protein
MTARSFWSKPDGAAALPFGVEPFEEEPFGVAPFAVVPFAVVPSIAAEPSFEGAVWP